MKMAIYQLFLPNESLLELINDEDDYIEDAQFPGVTKRDTII